jgi:mono/diheme cytochrome c family protein
MRAALCFAAAFALLGAGAATAADPARGRSLYESRCDGCHDESVHQRSPRRAASFEQIRAYVWRWSRELGTAWTDADLDAVAQYLNEKYYGFPCPPDVCKALTALHGPATPARR